VKVKSIGIIVLFLPLISLANEGKVCLGDTYEKVKTLKGFPESVSFVNTKIRTKHNTNSKNFEAVTFYKDHLLYVFNASNHRLCKIADNAQEDLVVLKRDSHKNTTDL